MSQEFEELVEHKAQANVRWLQEQGLLKPGEESFSRSLSLARAIKSGSETAKLSRCFSINSPDDRYPFVGCNQICDINGRKGGIEGPHDHCLLVTDPSGDLYFCRAPAATRLPDGSLPLCFDYHQTLWNEVDVERVRKGLFRLSPRQD